jgi:hypothetical protein
MNRSEADIADIVEYLNSQTLSGRALVYLNGPAFQASITTENTALQLLVNYSTYPYTTATEREQFRLVQAYALLTLYTQTYGRDEFFNPLNNGTANECEWICGTVCTAKDLGTAIGTVNVVTKLEFGFHLDGSLPMDLGLLTHLESVTARGSIGTLPVTIGQWSLLREFRAEGVDYNSGLTGTIPTSIANWTAIESFSVSNNAITGTLPATVIGQWSRLREFNVSDNYELTGTIPEAAMANWSAIETINAYNTGLSGSIPDSVCSTVTKTPFVGDNVVCACCVNISGYP